jgi:hypothetical protein
MSRISFDPYHKWLGIASGDRPPSHYQLLGIGRLESDVDVIEYNTDRQLLALRRFERGPHGELAKKIIQEVSAASRCLLNPGKKEKYDQGLPSIVRLPRPPAGTPAPPTLQSSVHGHSPPPPLSPLVHAYGSSPPVPPPVYQGSPTGSDRRGPAKMIGPDLITRSVVGQRLGRYRPARTRDRILSRGRKS